MTDTIPTWAIDEALRRCGFDPKLSAGHSAVEMCSHKAGDYWSMVYQLSLMIAKHEAPPEPVDADLVLARQVVRQVVGCDDGLEEQHVLALIQQVRAEPIEVTPRMVEAAHLAVGNQFSVIINCEQLKTAITAALEARGK